MARYYSKFTGGFYDDAIHGSRTMTIDDPAWVRPTRSVPGPQDGAKVADEADPDAVPPTIEVPNEHCLLPADAVPISDELHAALLAAQSRGEVITAAEDGSPVAVPRPAPTVAMTKQDLCNAVQQMLDAKARSLGYDDIRSAVSYADEPAVPTFQRDGLKLRAWRSLVWASCFEQMAQVDDGRVAMPSVDELLASLPPLGTIAG